MPLIDRRSFVLLGVAAAGGLAVRPALAQPAAWDAHLAKFASGFKGTIGIFGLKGEQWTTAKVKASPDECAYIIKGFVEPGSLFASGPLVDKVKYMTTRSDGSLIIAKKETNWLMAMTSTNSAIVCFYIESKQMNSGIAEKTLTKGVEYLKRIGY